MSNTISIKISFAILLFSNIIFGQVNNRTAILKQNKVNTFSDAQQKEKPNKTPKTVFSDREDNYTYEEPYSSKVKSKVGVGKAMYVIDQDKNYYEVVVADEKILGKPKGPLAIIQSKKFHFSDAKAVKYLGWIKKSNVIEFNYAQQNQENLEYVKYLLASNKVGGLYKSKGTIQNKEVTLKGDPNLEKNSKSKLNLNDFVYVFKINSTMKSAFVSNFDNLTPKDTVKQKKGWVALDYLTPIQNNIVVRLNADDTIKLTSNNTKIIGNELFKNTFFVNENQPSPKFNFENTNKMVFPINVWNHEKNKITNLLGEDISMKTISKIEEQSKIINIFYVFDNSLSNKQNLKKLLASIQNLKISISKEPFANYTFSYSFVAKGSKNYYLLKSDSFSKWFDLVEKSIKNPEEIDPKNVWKINENTTINQFLSDNVSFENNFFIIVGDNSTIHSILPDDNSKMIRNSSKMLFVVLENKSTTENQDFILQNKMYLKTASDRNKKFIQNYYVEQKLLVANDEFSFTDEYDNSFIFDAPKKSNFNGGIVFPKLDKEINPKTVNTAIDSILYRANKTNMLLLKSLRDYRSEFSFLRSEPSKRLIELIKNTTYKDSTSLEIPKNYKSELVVLSANDSLKKSFDSKMFLLMNKDEIKELIENYRELVVKDYTINEVDKEMVSSFYDKIKIFVNKQQKTNKIKSKSTLADLFYNKTGVLVNTEALYGILIKDIKKFKKKHEDFKALFVDLNTKLEKLEQMQRKDAFEVYNEESEVKYYYIPKQFLL